jgi:hypothetical protein
MISKSNSFIAKMGEQNILAEYSNYLQQAHVNMEKHEFYELHRSAGLLLSYAEFKDYYINFLVGKRSFVDELVDEFQFTTQIN